MSGLTKMRLVLADLLVEIELLRQTATELEAPEFRFVEREVEILQSSVHRILSVVDAVEENGPPS